MGRARQNLTRRMVQAARRWAPAPGEAQRPRPSEATGLSEPQARPIPGERASLPYEARTYGPEWASLAARRRGYEPWTEPSPEALARKLSLNSVYGKFGS